GANQVQSNRTRTSSPSFSAKSTTTARMRSRPSLRASPRSSSPSSATARPARSSWPSSKTQPASRTWPKPAARTGSTKQLFDNRIAPGRKRDCGASYIKQLLCSQQMMYIDVLKCTKKESMYITYLKPNQQLSGKDVLNACLRHCLVLTVR